MAELDRNRRKDRARACLLAGALGDALGAPVEFLTWSQIQQRYGPRGIQELETAYGRIGAITDDTQMTLFTAEAAIRAMVRAGLRGGCSPRVVFGEAYQRWLKTQGVRNREEWPEAAGWLVGVEELHARRAPGNTCLSALMAYPGNGVAAKNDSKGCGSVMRSAPFGFFPPLHAYVGECSDLTHGHVEARSASIVLCQMVAKLLEGKAMARAACEAAEQVPHTLTMKLMERARRLADEAGDPITAISELGQGWVAEEAIAIATYCAIRAEGDLLAGLRMAVNHSGDSDSTGSICGNLIGAAYGMEAVPEEWLAKLELREVIDQVAQDMVEVEFTHDLESMFDRYPGC